MCIQFNVCMPMVSIQMAKLIIELNFMWSILSFSLITNHREQNRALDSGISRVVLSLLMIQNERSSDTKVSTKGVDEH